MAFGGGHLHVLDVHIEKLLGLKEAGWHHEEPPAPRALPPPARAGQDIGADVLLKRGPVVLALDEDRRSYSNRVAVRSVNQSQHRWHELFRDSNRIGTAARRVPQQAVGGDDVLAVSFLPGLQVAPQAVQGGAA